MPKMSRHCQHDNNKHNDNNYNDNNNNNIDDNHNSFTSTPISHGCSIPEEEMQKPGFQEEEQGLVQGRAGQVQEQDVQGGQP